MREVTGLDVARVVSEPLRLAVVGCGSIGARHARNLRALDVPGLALCDLDRARAARLGAQVDAELVSDDLAAVLHGFRPHGLLVCTPPSSHLGIVARAVDAGAHVFCEKPLAADLAGVDALLARVARAGRFLMMGMCYRFHPGLRRFHEHLQAGVVGRLLGAQMWAGQFLPDWHPSADYRTEYSARRALGGGVLLDSIHSFDTLRWALGEPVEVTGMLGKVSDLEIDTEDVAAALVRLRGGVIVEVHVDYLQRHARSYVEVIGSEGSLHWDRTGIRWRRAGEEAWTEEAAACDPNHVYVAEMAEFLDCLATGRQPVLDGVEGRATLALALAVRDSAASGRLIRLPAAAAPALAEAV